MMEQLFKVLGDPNRLRIINLLLRDELCVCDLENSLDLLQTNVSRNLAKLRSVGLVEKNKNAQWVFYRINQQFISENTALVEYLNKRFAEDNQYKLDRIKCLEVKGTCTKPHCHT